MGIIKQEDIVGYYLDTELVCVDCTKDEELKDLTQDQIIEQSGVEDEEVMYFCDRCKKQLPT